MEDHTQQLPDLAKTQAEEQRRAQAKYEKELKSRHDRIYELLRAGPALSEVSAREEADHREAAWAATVRGPTPGAAASCAAATAAVTGTPVPADDTAQRQCV